VKDKTIDLMEPATKEWFARAIVGMILADGRIDKAEIDYLKNMLGYLNEKSLDESILKMLQSKKMPVLEPLEIVANESLEIVKHLTMIAVVDEDLASREVEFLSYVATQLGLPGEIANRFLSLAKKKIKSIRFNARIATEDFTEQVRCFDLTEDSCMFYSNRELKRDSQIALQFIKQSFKDNELKLYQVIHGTTAWSRSVNSKHGNFVVSVFFNNPLGNNQGYELLKLVLSIENVS